MLPKLEKLIAKCEELGLEVRPAGKKIGKQDCARVLREHHLPEGGLPYEELTPMLAFAEWNLKPEEQKTIWTSPTWVAQRKINGCRVIVHFVAGVGVFAHSRTVSVQTWRFQELTDQFLWKDQIPYFSATIDCEAIIDKPIDTRQYTNKGEITKTSLHSTTAALHLEAENSRLMQMAQSAPLVCQAFDITSFEGKDLRDLPLYERVKKLAEFRNLVDNDTEWSPYFEFPQYRVTDKRTFFDEIIANGGEGIMLKNRNSKYSASSSRKRDAWVKVKKRVEYDAFVTGFLRGDADTAWKDLVGALEFSVMTDKGLHPIAMCTNLKLKTRKKITIYDKETDTVSLDPRLMGRVAEVSGQDISSRSMRLSHATIERWRPTEGPDSKSKEECMVSMEDIREAAAWAG